MKLGLGLSLANRSVSGRRKSPSIVTNSDFSNLAGLTYQSNGWYGGVPFGWNTETSTTDYSVLSYDSYFYANLGALSDTRNTFKTFYQNLGTLQTSSAYNISLKASTLQGPSNQLGYAFYNSTTGEVLLNGDVTITAPPWEPQTVLTSASGTAGTPIRISFWGVSGSIGITDISITKN